MARWTVFTGNDVWKCSWACAVMSITEPDRLLMQRPPRARRLQTSNIEFCPCPLRTEVSPNSLSPMILRTVKYLIIKVFPIFHWETLFSNCSCVVCTLVNFCPYLLLEIQPLWNALFMPGPLNHLLTSFKMLLWVLMHFYCFLLHLLLIFF